MTAEDKGSSMFAYAAGHFLVDFACGFKLYQMYSEGELEEVPVALIFAVYNLIAFSTQFLTGALADLLRDSGRWAAAIGCLITAAGIAVGYHSPWTTAVLLGLGNSCFHAGGGIDALTRGRGMTRAGIFVSTGALGISAGCHFGTDPFISGWIVILFLACAAFFIPVLCPAPRQTSVFVLKEDPETGRPDKKDSYVGTAAAVVMILAAVIVRSWAGLAAPQMGTESKLAWLLPAAAAFAGKFAGGIFADLFGARRVGTVCVAVSAPLFFLGYGHWLIFLAAVFLFNIAMPITLCELARRLPGWEGFAFGLTALALFVGYMLDMLLRLPDRAERVIVPVLCAVTAVWIFLTSSDRKTAE